MCELVGLYYFSNKGGYDGNVKRVFNQLSVDINYETNLATLLAKIVDMQPQILIIDENAIPKGYDFLNLFDVDSAFFVPSVLVMCEDADVFMNLANNIFVLQKNNYFENAKVICDKHISKKYILTYNSVFPFTHSEEINSALTELGINPRLNGSVYLKECINCVILNNCRAMDFNNNVYSQISAKYGTTTSNIERCIRSAINCAWKDSQDGNKSIFNNNIEFKHKPSVKEIVFYLANVIRDREIEGRFRKILNPTIVASMSRKKLINLG